MKDIFQQIWELALPYQDKREDLGHAEVTLHYAQILLGLEGGDEDIVIPAIMLHDIGWSQLTQEEWLVVFNLNAKDEDKTAVQLKHQTAGVELARTILSKVNYPKEMTDEILEIISQHDTRDGFISKNEGLVRDADKLWRTSKVGFAASNAKRTITREQAIQRLETNLKKQDAQNTLFSNSAKRIQNENMLLLKRDS